MLEAWVTVVPVFDTVGMDEVCFWLAEVSFCHASTHLYPTPLHNPIRPANPYPWCTTRAQDGSFQPCSSCQSLPNSPLP